MSKTSIYLGKEHLEELRKRQEFINHYKIIVEFLKLEKSWFWRRHYQGILNLFEQQKSLWFTAIFSLYKVDSQKRYDIDMKTGKVTESANGIQLPTTKKDA